MTSPVDKSSERAHALLALGLTREQAEFHAPSDEELACLLEANSGELLDSTRKAQIMDAIANDPATFTRWMGMVETAQTLEIGSFSSAAAIEKDVEKAPSALSRLGSFIADHVRSLMATGGAVGLAVAMAVVFLLPVGMDSRVTGLYDDYGSTWESKPQQLDVIRSGKKTDVAALSPEDQSLQAGLQAGLKLLGPDFQIRGLADASKAGATDSSLNEDLAFALNSVGQIAAISHFKCSLGANEEYFTTAWAAIQAFAPVIEQADDETSKALSTTIARSGSAETQVCRVSKLIVSRVSP